MAKLKKLSGADVCVILEKYGFREKRRKGSHIIMQRNEHKGTCTVPVPNHKELKPGTLASIIRQSSVPRAEFE